MLPEAHDDKDVAESRANADHMTDNESYKNNVYLLPKALDEKKVANSRARVDRMEDDEACKNDVYVLPPNARGDKIVMLAR